MSSKIVPGKYQARISNYAVGETKSGNLQVMILLDYTDKDGDPHEITWFGSLKEGQAREITVETLVKCGLKGNDLSNLGEGLASGLLDVETPVTIAVIEHTYDGKTSMRVQWIGRSGGSSLDKRIPSADAKAKLAGMNLKALVMQARLETGIKDEPKRTREPGEDDMDAMFADAQSTGSFGPA